MKLDVLRETTADLAKPEPGVCVAGVVSSNVARRVSKGQIRKVLRQGLTLKALGNLWKV